MTTPLVRRLVYIALFSLAIGAAVNTAVGVWMCGRDRASAETSTKWYPHWPAGTPEEWFTRPKVRNSLLQPGLAVDAFEHTADRSFMSTYYLASPSFKDRRIASTANGRDAEFDEDLSADPDVVKRLATVKASQQAALDKILAQIEDRTALTITTGWPYPSFTGTCWIVHGYNPVTLKWSSRVSQSRAIVAIGPPPTEGPWRRIYPWSPAWAGFASNTAIFATPAAILLGSFFLLRRRYRLEGGGCPRCGYPVGWTAACAECGLPGPVWNQARLARLERRKGPARPRPILFALSVFALGVGVATSLGVTAELKAGRSVVGLGGGALILGATQIGWGYPGPAVYMAPANVAIWPRVSTIGQAVRIIVPLWPAFVAVLAFGVRKRWHQGICRAARDLSLTRQACPSTVTHTEAMPTAA